MSNTAAPTPNATTPTGALSAADTPETSRPPTAAAPNAASIAGAPSSALYPLLAWSSPGYPTGAFSYSHGLEWAVEQGTVTNLQTLLDYVTAVIERGGGWVDAVLFAHAWRATRAAPPAPTSFPPGAQSATGEAEGRPPATDLPTLTTLASAFRGSAETALESRQQGAAFLDVTRKAWPHPTLDTLTTPIAHCIAVAVACAAHDIPLEPALHSYIHAVAANLVSAGARLIPLGQTQAQIAIARLAPTITVIAQKAQTTPLDDLGTSAPVIEICSLKHETQYTRLFRS